MLTRVRIEAEGTSPTDVEEQLATAYEVLVKEASRAQKEIMFGEVYGDGSDGLAFPALADAQAGEFVIERFSRDARDESGEMQPGHGGIVYRGRMTSHFARPQKVQKLDRHHD